MIMIITNRSEGQGLGSTSDRRTDSPDREEVKHWRIINFIVTSHTYIGCLGSITLPRERKRDERKSLGVIFSAQISIKLS